MDRTCIGCGTPLNLYRSQAKTCSTRCRVKVHRDAKTNPIPRELRMKARWVRWAEVKRAGRTAKVPMQANGAPAAVNDPSTWCTYEAAVKSPVGHGVGFVLTGDDVSCVDLDDVLVDGVLDPRAAEFLIGVDAFYVEVSPSGRGVHAWTHCGSPTGRRVFTLPDGLKVEWYSTGRYLTVTGQRFNL